MSVCDVCFYHILVFFSFATLQIVLCKWTIVRTIENNSCVHSVPKCNYMHMVNERLL